MYLERNRHIYVRLITKMLQQLDIIVIIVIEGRDVTTFCNLDVVIKKHSL